MTSADGFSSVCLENMTQVVSIIAVPCVAGLLFAVFGRGAIQAGMGLIGGILLLISISLATGIAALGLNAFFSDTASCSVPDFFALSGGIGCSPGLVATCYAIIFYGLANLVLILIAPKDRKSQ